MGFSYGDNSSQVTLIEERRVLHSACEWAAAGPDDGNNTPQQQHIALNSLSRTTASVECAGYRSTSDQGLIAAANNSSSTRWLEVTASAYLQWCLVAAEIVNSLFDLYELF